MLFKILYLYFIFIRVIPLFQINIATAQTTQENQTQELLATLLISEVYPHPYLDESEWIEIYNPTSEPINITGYSLYEHISQNKLLIQFSSEDETPIIQPESFYVYTLSSNKLNNSEELITLENSENILIDSFRYTNSVQGQSFNTDIYTKNPPFSDIYLAQPTPNEVNHEHDIPNEDPITTSTEGSQPSKQENTEMNTQNTAEIQNIPNESNQATQLTQKINVPLLQYQRLASELNRIPSIQKMKSEKIQPREAKFSYLVQKHVSTQGIVNAIIGASLLLLTGFLL